MQWGRGIVRMLSWIGVFRLHAQSNVKRPRIFKWKYSQQISQKNEADNSSCWSNKVSSSWCLVFDSEDGNLSSAPRRTPIAVDIADAPTRQSVVYKISLFYYILVTQPSPTDTNTTTAVFIATSKTSRCLASARELLRGRVQVGRKGAKAAVPNRANPENCERRTTQREEEVVV